MATLVVLSLLSGCENSQTSTTATQPARDAFRVAVVVPGTTADAGWNYSAKEAAQAIQKELGLRSVSFVENVEQSRRKETLRGYGRDGFRLVFCHGYEFNQIVKEVASEFPNVAFIVSGYDQPDPKFGSIVYQLGEAAYVCGAMAAAITQTGHVGFIAAQQVPPVELCYKGFREGFLKYRPGGSVRTPFYIEGTHPWEDSSAAKEKTLALLRVTQPAPIDLLFQNADAASRGIFEAVEQQPGRIFVFGSNRDQNDTTATKRVIASAVIHVDKAFVKAARAVRDGTYKPHVESETIATGVIECVPSPRLEQLVGKETAQAALAAVKKATAEFASPATTASP
jgi:basic membrane lipoprotein Med (substrate-binding protein (PBP1-ABC) superfamily)